MQEQSTEHYESTMGAKFRIENNSQGYNLTEYGWKNAEKEALNMIKPL